jgi:hypothetical protein
MVGLRTRPDDSALGLRANMNDNPYAPPTAPVTDIEPAGSLERPPIVSRAVFLLWASFVLIFPGAVYNIIHPDPDMSRGETIVFWIFGLGISGAISYWLNTSAWKGKGYARWVLAVLSVLGFALVLWAEREFPELPKSPWYIQSIDFLSSIVAVAGNALLFVPSANAWYREMKR